jgi:hypothetical protein
MGIVPRPGAQRLQSYSAFFDKISIKGNYTPSPRQCPVLKLCGFRMPFERFWFRENRPSGCGEIVDFFLMGYDHIRK